MSSGSGRRRSVAGAGSSSRAVTAQPVKLRPTGRGVVFVEIHDGTPIVGVLPISAAAGTRRPLDPRTTRATSISPAVSTMASEAMGEDTCGSARP